MARDVNCLSKLSVHGPCIVGDKMLLVLLGTQPHHFNRLLKELEELVDEHVITENQDNIVVQAGFTPITAEMRSKMSMYTFINNEEYEFFLQQADIVITHGGAGSIFDALRLHKKIIVLPRTMELGEHVDNHQHELVKVLKKDNYIISEETLKQSFAKIADTVLKEYIPQQEHARRMLKCAIEE